MKALAHTAARTRARWLRQGSAALILRTAAIVIFLVAFYQETAGFPIEHSTKPHFKSTGENISVLKPSDQEEIAVPFRKRQEPDLVDKIVKETGGLSRGFIGTNQYPVWIRFFSVSRPFQGRHFSFFANLQFVSQLQKYSSRAAVIDKTECQTIPRFLNVAAIFAFPTSSKATFDNLEADKRGFQFNESSFGNAGGPFGGKPQSNCGSGKNSSEKRNISIRIIEKSLPPFDDESNERKKRAAKNTYIFFSGLIGTPLILYWIAKGKP
jgi:hypothetical protein